MPFVPTSIVIDRKGEVKSLAPAFLPKEMAVLNTLSIYGFFVRIRTNFALSVPGKLVFLEQSFPRQNDKLWLHTTSMYASCHNRLV